MAKKDDFADVEAQVDGSMNDDSKKHVQPESDDPKLASKAGPSGVEHADQSDAERAASPEKKDEVRAEEDAEDDQPKGKRSSKAKAPERLPYHRYTPDGALHVAFPGRRSEMPAEDAKFACHGCGSNITGADLEEKPKDEAKKA